jgi:ABC-type dipeptide/oligopeptide/nickel transport system permease component
MAVALAIAIPAGIIGALRQNTWADYSATSIAMVGVSIPEFFIGVILLLVFSIGLGGLLPSSGWVYLPGTCPSMVCGISFWGNLQHVLMPALALGVGRAALLTRLLRASMLEVIRTEYVTTARAKGLGERPVVFKHALKNALIPTITVMGLQVGFLIGGAIVVETLFAMPGLGTFGIDAIIARDYQQVQGFALVTALTFVGINLLVDLTYTFLDPVRLREARRHALTALPVSRSTGRDPRRSPHAGPRPAPRRGGAEEGRHAAGRVRQRHPGHGLPQPARLRDAVGRRQRRVRARPPDPRRPVRPRRR